MRALTARHGFSIIHPNRSDERTRIITCAQGIIALHNAGFTKSDGYGEFLSFLERHPDPDEVSGYCYYHSQDLDRALHGQGLNIGFGPRPDEDEQTQGTKVRVKVANELKEVGLDVSWDGTFDTRILIPHFEWQRR
jgi:hypothetical protein